MFRRIQVRVTTGQAVVFHFAEPLSIETVTVARPDNEQIYWELINDAFKHAEVTESSFQSWPIDQAPEWALKAHEQVEARAAARIESQGPYFPARESLAYGEVPAGYREDLPARPLTPGKYILTIFAEQGSVGQPFEVPVA
jgi:hypothetical protein